MSDQLDLSSEHLRSFRSQKDIVADQIIDKIIHNNVGGINTVFEKLTRNRSLKEVDLPQEIKEYFDAHSKMPDWADHDKLHLGQKVYAEYGLEISMLLFFLSLPAAYSCWRGAKVLTFTGRLVEDRAHLSKAGHEPAHNTNRLNRRLMETAQFVVDVMAPESFHENGSGIISCLKVRLMHGAVRHLILDTNRWDEEELGQPINQMDMAGTLQSFAALIIQGLQNMGFELSKKEIDAYYHCWHVAGHFMGVTPEMNPATYEDGLALGHAIINDQSDPARTNESSDKLIHALIEYVNEKIPGRAFDNYVPIFLIKYFLNKNVHSAFNFHLKPKFLYVILEFIIKLLVSFTKLQKRIHKWFASRHFEEGKNHIMNEMLTYLNDHKKIQFFIPDSLRESWTEKLSK